MTPLEILNFRHYEQLDSAMIFALVRDGDIVLDIGGNIGYYSIALAKMRNATIHAFEPIESTYKQFIANAYYNGVQDRMRINNFGLFDKSGELTFYVYKQDFGNASAAIMHEEKDNEKIVCKVERLDEYVKAQGVERIDFIKLDVEGAEIFALRGGLKSIEQHKPILFVEMLRKWAAKYGYHPNEIIAMLEGLGYECYYACEQDSALGSHSADLAHFEATADHKSSSAPKCAKNYESTTAIPRILEEDKQAWCKNADTLESTFAKSPKVDSSNEAQNLNDSAKDSSPKAESTSELPTPEISPSDSKILDEKCGLQGKSQGSYLSGSDRRDFSPLPHFSLKAESPQVDSRINAKNLTTPQAVGFCDDFGGFQGGGKGAYLAYVTAATAAESAKSAQKPTPIFLKQLKQMTENTTQTNFFFLHKEKHKAQIDRFSLESTCKNTP